jgi:hypothetical protein
METALVLVISGVMIGGVMKGKHLLEDAKASSTVQQLQEYRHAMDAYFQTYGYFPGDDPKASSRFGQSVSNGHGNGSLSLTDQPLVWKHLHAAQLIDTPAVPSAKIGGNFVFLSHVDNDHQGNWLIISQNSHEIKPTITPAIASKILSKSGNHDPLTGWIQVLPTSSPEGQKCLKNKTIDFSNTSKVCVVGVELE